MSAAPRRIGFTGHQQLDDATAWPWVAETLRTLIAALRTPFVGVCSLAAGSDQLFARIVLDRPSELEVIVPSRRYGTIFSDNERRDYEALLARASRVETLDWPNPDEHAFLAAGRRIVETSDEVIAVWDGKPPAGPGGTGDIVAYARLLGRPVTHIDPSTRQSAGAEERSAH